MALCRNMFLAYFLDRYIWYETLTVFDEYVQTACAWDERSYAKSSTFMLDDTELMGTETN